MQKIVDLFCEKSNFRKCKTHIMKSRLSVLEDNMNDEAADQLFWDVILTEWYVTHLQGLKIILLDKKQ